MSQEHVEIVQRGMDAFNRRDVDLVAELTTPDFAWFPAMAEPVEGGVYRGREGIEAYFADLCKTWEELRILPAHFHDLGRGVLVLGRIEGRGVGSGVPVGAQLRLVYELRGGKVAGLGATSTMPTPSIAPCSGSQLAERYVAGLCLTLP